MIANVRIQIKCQACGAILEGAQDVADDVVYVDPCACTNPEPKPERIYWSDLVKKLEGRTVELHYYRVDGGYREFDCLLHAGGEDGKVYIFDQDAKTVKSLIKKNICSVFDYTDDMEYQVIGGLY